MIGSMTTERSPGPLLAIGESARLTRLTTKALRIYAESGLLRPEQVDRTSGYRYYSIEQARTARLIGLLRATDLGLAEIARLLAELDIDAAQAAELLDGHLRSSKPSTRAAEHSSATSTPSSAERTHRCSRSTHVRSPPNE